ncbi:hypothetical protein RJ639_009523 [Escallonia herrerae]|uniref:DUF569 domain-containing protein n=1 Tax=Escallonia herrerae TaxID=1293975 RepID=A0AA88VYR3_9ASTE|nr:hypothetical protein RJ639_009523 [Escallonia herrerae]
MELFRKAKTVRLRTVKDKYLIAQDDQESVYQDRDGSSRNALWTVEFVDGENFLRLISCYGKYLTASNTLFLPSATGRKVLQTNKTDSSVDWEPLRDGFQVRLRTRSGHFLRPNGGVPPWRNSVTHDIPHRSRTQEKVLWDVDVAEILPLHQRTQSEAKFNKSRSTSSGLATPKSTQKSVIRLEHLLL